MHTYMLPLANSIRNHDLRCHYYVMSFHVMLTICSYLFLSLQGSETGGTTWQHDWEEPERRTTSFPLSTQIKVSQKFFSCCLMEFFYILEVSYIHIYINFKLPFGQSILMFLFMNSLFIRLLLVAKHFEHYFSNYLESTAAASLLCSIWLISDLKIV